MSTGIKCTNDHDHFCFVCGDHIFQMARRPDFPEPKKIHVNEPKFVEAYKKKFNMDPLNRNTQWSPSLSCSACYAKLTKPNREMNIRSSMEWFEPENHPTDCHFCQTKIPIGINKSKRGSIEYANVSSVKKARLTTEGRNTDPTAANVAQGVPEALGGGDEIDYLDEASNNPSISASTVENVATDEPMDTGVHFEVSQVIQILNPFNIGDSAAHETPNPLNIHHSTASLVSFSLDSGASTSSHATPSSGSVFKPPRYYQRISAPPEQPREIIELTQERLNDIVRDMNSSKYQSEFLASRLKDLAIRKSKFFSLSG